MTDSPHGYGSQSFGSGVFGGSGGLYLPEEGGGDEATITLASSVPANGAIITIPFSDPIVIDLLCAEGVSEESICVTLDSNLLINAGVFQSGYTGSVSSQPGNITRITIVPSVAWAGNVISTCGIFAQSLGSGVPATLSFTFQRAPASPCQLKYGLKWVNLELGYFYEYNGAWSKFPIAFSDGGVTGLFPHETGSLAYCNDTVYYASGDVYLSDWTEIWEYKPALQAFVLLAATDKPPAMGDQPLLAAIGNQLFLVGQGRHYDDSLAQYVNDGTWRWDSSRWTKISDGPTPRSLGALAVHNDRVYLFGGQLPNRTQVNDMYVFDGESWTTLNPTHRPSARDSHAMTSAGTKLVLFGGTSGFDALSDTWEWGGSDWVEKTPASAPTPAAYTAFMGSCFGTAVLFGRGNTWAWDGSSWSSAAATSSTPPELVDTLTNRPCEIPAPPSQPPIADGGKFGDMRIPDAKRLPRPPMPGTPSASGRRAAPLPKAPAVLERRAAQMPLTPEPPSARRQALSRARVPTGGALYAMVEYRDVSADRVRTGKLAVVHAGASAAQNAFEFGQPATTDTSVATQTAVALAGAGLCAAGASKVGVGTLASSSAPLAARAAPRAVLIDRSSRDIVLDDSGAEMDMSPTDQRVFILLNTAYGSRKSDPTMGFSRPLRMSASIESETRDRIKEALMPLIEDHSIELLSVTTFYG